MLISVVAEETRPNLFNAYEPFNFNLCCLLLKKTLVITTYLTNPESTSEDVYVILGSRLDIRKVQNSVSKH